VNSTLAQQEDLVPAAKRIHDDFPLFEGCTHETNLKSVTRSVEVSSLHAEERFVAWLALIGRNIHTRTRSPPQEAKKLRSAQDLAEVMILLPVHHETRFRKTPANQLLQS
jgi:hypothetical protein